MIPERIIFVSGGITVYEKKRDGTKEKGKKKEAQKRNQFVIVVRQHDAIVIFLVAKRRTNKIVITS